MPVFLVPWIVADARAFDARIVERAIKPSISGDGLFNRAFEFVGLGDVGLDKAPIADLLIRFRVWLPPSGT